MKKQFILIKKNIIKELNKKEQEKQDLKNY